MTDDQAREIQKVVEPFRQTEGMNCALSSYSEALSVVKEHSWVSGCDPEEVEVAVALCLLGPQWSGPPPAPHRQAIIDHLRSLAPGDPLSRLEEIVIAYGCGWGRSCSSGNPWDDQWRNAIISLIERGIIPAVEKVHKWLRQKNLPGYPKIRDPQQELWQDAERLAALLTNPTFDRRSTGRLAVQFHVACEQTKAGPVATGSVEVILPEREDCQHTILASSRYIFAPSASVTIDVTGTKRYSAKAGTRVVVLARDDDARISAGKEGRRKIKPGGDAYVRQRRAPLTLQVWQCTCGWEKCPSQHRLVSWNPSPAESNKPLTLWAFTANAVSGPIAEAKDKKSNKQAKGSPNRKKGFKPKLGTLLNGIYLPFLISEGW